MLGSMTSLTGGGGFQGGSAGPSTASGKNDTNSGFNFDHGAVNFGSNNGIPSWVLIGALAIGGWYVYKKVK